MRGCILHGKVVFADDQMNVPRKPIVAEKPAKPAAKPSTPRRRLPF